MSLGSILSAAAPTLLGKVLDLGVSSSHADKQAEQQERFAKQGIRWRVADAKAAGLHPLAALGASGASYSPTSIVSDLGSAGQEISRSIEATRTSDERKAAQAAADVANQTKDRMAEDEHVLRKRLLSAQIENMDAQTAELNRRGQPNNPPFPSGAAEGVGGSGVMFSAPDPRAKPPPVDRYIPDPPRIPTARSDNPGMLAGPPTPLTKMGAIVVDGVEYDVILPNTDIDALMEEPLAAAAILAALNPHLHQKVVDHFVRSGQRSFEKKFREVWNRDFDAFKRLGSRAKKYLPPPPMQFR